MTEVRKEKDADDMEAVAWHLVHTWVTGIGRADSGSCALRYGYDLPYAGTSYHSKRPERQVDRERARPLASGVGRRVRTEIRRDHFPSSIPAERESEMLTVRVGRDKGSSTSEPRGGSRRCSEFSGVPYKRNRSLSRSIPLTAGNKMPLRVSAEMERSCFRFP